MIRRKLIILLFIFTLIIVGTIFTGCNSDGKGQDSESSNTKNNKDTSTEDYDICVFKQENVLVMPEVNEYSYDNARQIGTTQEIDGMLPGTSEGTWYIIVVDGVEYYFGKYDYQETEDIVSYGYSIISDKYSLANGISVGMTEDEILKSYPNMAIIDFKNEYVHKEITGHQGWNGTAYPRSYIGIDSDWDYDGEDYYWTNQFDYVMIADIDMSEQDTLPVYLALLIKDNVITAITFYYPTAG